MAKVQKPLFESFGVPVVSTPDPTRPEERQAHDADLDVHTPSVTDAVETFMLGQGIEAPDVEPPPSPHADLWMLGTPTYQRKIAFTESVGSRFGDIALTSRFLLDRWSETPDGFVWTLDQSADAEVVPSSRAADLLDGTFTRTRAGLRKLAVAKHGGDMEAAIIQAIDEHMTMIGLDRFVPEEPPQEVW